MPAPPIPNPASPAPWGSKSLKVKVENDSLTFLHVPLNTGLSVTFQRTLRIPDDGKSYPLPPGMGAFPLRRVLDYKDRVPASWLKTSGVFLPMYQREAMWIRFHGRDWRPNALKIAAGKINAVSGKPWSQKLKAEGRSGSFNGEPELDYMVCPPQPWIDGFKTDKDVIRQFIAMPLGMGYTVEGQVTGKEEHGGVQIIVYEPKAGRFPDVPPPRPRYELTQSGTLEGAPPGFGPPPAPGAYGAPPPAFGPPLPGASGFGPPPAQRPKAAGTEMGLGTGGKITQKIYPDPHGIDTWDEDHYGRVFIHIVNSMMWREITGEPPPPTPVTAQSYTQAGYPWFKLYDEDEPDVGGSPILNKVKSIAQMDASHGFVGVEDNSSVDVPDAQVRGIPKNEVPEGDW
jgi:hypothetical protein